MDGTNVRLMSVGWSRDTDISPHLCGSKPAATAHSSFCTLSTHNAEAVQIIDDCSQAQWLHLQSQLMPEGAAGGALTQRRQLLPGYQALARALAEVAVTLLQGPLGGGSGGHGL